MHPIASDYMEIFTLVNKICLARLFNKRQLPEVQQRLSAPVHNTAAPFHLENLDAGPQDLVEALVQQQAIEEVKAGQLHADVLQRRGKADARMRGLIS